MDVTVLRSKKKPDTYLYLPSGEEYENLPEGLRNQFGEAEPFLNFELTLERKLAIADPKVVLQALDHQGFYLQMPVDQTAINQLIGDNR